ncbi:MAG: hypothetical protein KKB81_00675 [Candidatus Margulisbacteria bacterium]|nr:hypothetical protein [Candidatus Margulisiibacteriota bacterium]MBU1021492.1 hypothetical protein [Candidatus Margulisiibacteriota bacterium]MBU1728577.1 hypothetical protein [Candidatus Margulisiibacteriota bacterium]MBU1955844.1 hypothetical protein [Candidatus Margulisiibacteriota bacterium]
MSPLTGREKATIFLSLLGADTSARLLRYLPEELADLVASGVNHLPKPSPKAVASILEELRSFMSLPPSTAYRPAKKVVTYAPQPEPEPAPAPVPAPPPEPEPEPPKTPAEKFQRASARKLAGILLYERPQIIAFVLKMVSPEKQIEVLSNLPGQRPLVEALLRESKENIFTDEIKDKVISSFASKL